MAMQFVKATKHQGRARIAIDGPSGAGKTYTALVAATVMANGGKIAVIDTERGSASLYSDKFAFDVLELETYNPAVYIDAIHIAEKAGYSVIVIDSLSHAWEGEGGLLELHDEETVRTKGNSYTAWKNITPLQRKLIDAMLKSKCHVIATMRSKMEYLQEKDEKTGRTTVKKIGLAPVQRQGMEYEFTIVADMDTDHSIFISKSRCDIMADKVEKKPGVAFFEPLRDWLNSGDVLAIAAEVEKAVEQMASAVSRPEPSAPDNGQKPNDVVAEDATLITIWDGKRQKPAQGLLDAKTITGFIDAFVTTEAHPGKHFSHANHLKNHLRSHFQVDTMQEMTWEKTTALVNHIKKVGDDPRWYKPEEKTTAPETTSDIPDTSGVDLDKLAQAWKQVDHAVLSPEDAERIKNMTALVKAGALEKDDYAGMVDVLRT